jgi:hypothetical protein
MQALHDYIIKPKGGRYNNSTDVDGKNLILNTEVFNHQYVNREAEVLAVPAIGDTDIKVGDTVIVHHNVFRRWHNIRGEEKNSRSYFEEDKYFVTEDQVFAYKENDKWKPLKGYCFVKPIKNKDMFSEAKERPLIGIVKYTDGSVDVGDLVGYEPYNEFEFIVDNQRLYRVLSNDINVIYEYQGDEEEYNPSWT